MPATATPWTTLALATLAVGVGCGQIEPASVEPSQPARVVATVVENSTPDGSDAPPKLSLARLTQKGSLLPLPGEYVAAVEFRHGQAAVTMDRELVLVRADGSKSVLAREVDGLPARAADGALVYAAKFADTVEIHWLSVEGTVQRLASFRGSATRLAPEGDRQVVFVGAKRGGVSGVWFADAKGARCLSNCELRVGKAWGDAYRTPPGDASKIRIVGNTVQWQNHEGAWESASLEGAL